MKTKLKIIAVLPAYRSVKTLDKFLVRFPYKYFDEVILVDDVSGDGTFEIAREIGERRGIGKIRVFRNNSNLGYGGNVKRCLGLALEKGADIIVEIHPDGEYGFDGIEPGIEAVKKGAEFVLGNRFKKDALKNGLPVWKYPFLKGLSFLGNIILGTKIPDMHQGFRIYTKELLKQINYKSFSDGYIFSFEIIVAAAKKGLKISSVSVSVKYTGPKRGASLRSSILYSLGVLKILFFGFKTYKN